MALSKHATDFVRFLIKETNGNPNRPLFNGVRITNKTSKHADISDGIEYIVTTKNQVASELIENKKSLLQEYVDNHEDDHSQRVVENYRNYLDLLDDEDDSKTIKQLESDIICLLINVSRKIGTDSWSRNLLTDLESYGDRIS